MDANTPPDDQDPYAVARPAPEHAVRPPGEIGGKKFRVGLDAPYVPFRNRTRRRRRALGFVLSGLLILGVGAYGLVNLVTAPSAGSDACKAGAVRAAASASPSANPLSGAAVSPTGTPKFTLNVYNSTNRRGLAANTANQLKQRGFFIGQVTNDPLRSKLTVSAQIRGAKSQVAELRQVAAEVPGAQIHPDNRTDPSVDLVLGTGFSTLASNEQVDAALRAAAALAAASPAALADSTNCAQ
ncbi:LytR C-terminal domain-containing protein [Actinospica durhamensis]|uniref:LytR C-terminal domain-containing protein n=1 Tax=Actinospica durhamensis TaxID=1508375 RepID=A0A941EYZ5_9ACTN|nr:LytR C-terminal domain-containing protein [Actinospica durhamensis]MBR7839118.1 LytR C-terminal domain-containing protein [Actinospica durhamensis]